MNEHPLRRWRERAELTLEELSRKTGLSNGYLSMLERDIRGASLETASRLSEMTGIPLKDFIREIEREPAQ